jgi:hypothetical protein
MGTSIVRGEGLDVGYAADRRLILSRCPGGQRDKEDD